MINIEIRSIVQLYIAQILLLQMFRLFVAQFHWKNVTNSQSKRQTNLLFENLYVRRFG